MQNRIDYETRSISDLSEESLTAQVRRLRLRFGGWVANPKWKFNLQLSFSRSDMDWDDTGFPGIVRDAVIIYESSPELQFAFGQTKLPGNRQRVISSGDQQFIDRSIVNRQLNLDRDFGVQMLFANKLFRGNDSEIPLNFRFAITSGDGRNSVTAQEPGLMYTARGELLPLGAFKHSGDYSEGDLEYEEDLKLSIGWGYSYVKNATRTRANSGVPIGEGRSFGNAFADLVAKWRGISFYAEYMNRIAPAPVVNGTSAPGTAKTPTTTIFSGEGVNLQAGAFVSETLEIVTRYASTFARGESRPNIPRNNQWVLGVNRYIQGHRLKVQGDLTYDQVERRGDQWISRFQVELGI